MGAAPVVNAGEFAGWNAGAGGVGWAGDQDGAGGRGGVALDQFPGELEVAAGVDREGDRTGIAKLGEMPVAGITGIGHQHLVARACQQAQRQQQRAGCAGGDDDPCGLDRNLPACGVKPGNRLAQRG